MCKKLILLPSVWFDIFTLSLCLLGMPQCHKWRVAGMWLDHYLNGIYSLNSFKCHVLRAVCIFLAI